MSTGDDHLAPVIPLFGGSGAVSPDGAEHPSKREPARGSGRGGRRQHEGAEGDAAAPEPALPTFATFWPGGGSGDGEEAAANGWATAPSGSDEVDEPAETLEAAQHRAENISMHALTRRGVSSREMEKTLRSRDLPEEVVLAEVARLERVGLLDDAALAETLVRTKQDRKGLGKSAIAAELRQRGLAQEAVDEAVAEIDDDDEQARADEWARKRAGQLRGLDHATAERRLNGYLMRRGYRSEVVRRAIAAALPRGGATGGGVRFE
jgi:regulatory protein